MAIEATGTELSAGAGGGGRRLAWLGLAVLLGLVGLALGLLFKPLSRPEAPTPEQWLEAARQVRDGWKEGDLVRLEPYWLTAGRVFFGDVDGGPRTPFRVLDLHRTLDVPYLYAHKRVWVVLSVEARDAWNDARIPSAEPLGRWDFAAITVLLYRMPDQALAFRLTESMGDLRVERERNGHPKVCRSDRGVHRCGEASLDVKKDLRQVAGGPRQCVLVRPGAEPVHVTIPVPGEAGTFFLRFGNTVEAGRQKDGGDVTVSAEVDGEALPSVLIRRPDYALHEWEIPVSGEGGAQVRITLATDDSRKREVCFDGYLVRTGWCEGEALEACRQGGK